MVNADEIPGHTLSMERTEKLIDDEGFTERLTNLYEKTPRELAKTGLSYD